MCEQHPHSHAFVHDEHHDFHALEDRVAQIEQRLDLLKKRLHTRDVVADTVSVLDADGRTRVRVEVAAGSPEIRLLDADGRVRACVRLGADGAPQFDPILDLARER